MHCIFVTSISDPCSELIPLIDGPKPLPDSQIKASSSESHRSAPDTIKMKTKGKNINNILINK